jgi:GT2 family glycosyltransferase
MEILPVNGPATASALNRAAGGSGGEVLCFLDAGYRPLAEDWLREVVSFAVQGKIGAVGAKLMDEEGTIASAGVIIGQNGTAGLAHRGLPRGRHGNFVRARLVGNFSAVSIACLVTRREVFEAAGGFDAQDLEHELFAEDYCLRLGRMGYRVVFTPYAELAGSGEAERSVDDPARNKESKRFAERWAAEIGRDPFYNPNFKKTGPTFRLGT